jgi:hypothetical protein
MRETFVRSLFGRLAIALISVAPMPVLADARTDVQGAFGRVIDAGGFRAEATGRVFGPESPPMSGQIDVVFPNRIHARTDSMEFIVTAQGAWVSALGVWVPADRSLLPVTAFDPAAMHKAIASIRDVREEGTSKTAQCPARVYRFRASGQLPGADANGDMRVWICEANGKPARLEAIDARNGKELTVDFDWAHRARVDAPDE